MAGGAQKKAIQLEQVRFGWLTDQPVIDISEFSVGQGEKLFISGPSGSGKSTLLALLGGVAKADRGRVEVLATDLSKLGTARRDHFRAAHIGFVFQMFNLIPYLSLIENVTLPCRFSHERAARSKANASGLDGEARRLLDHLDLRDETLLHRPVTQLSMGQQQRVAVARALIGRPEIVIADEPTSALDADTREVFLELLMHECEEARSALIFVSHDTSLARMFDRSVALADINRIMPANNENN